MTTTDLNLRDILSVTALNQRVKAVLQRSIPPGWIRGEVSNLRRQSSGHIYFSLKDEKSQVSAVAFRGNAERLGLDLRDGMQVVVYGEISVYEPRGTYQLIVRAAIEDGVGRLQMEFERLKKQLAAEGLFESERKKPLPDLPATIGVITSPTGAAVQDFLRILRRRNWRGRIIVLPVKVQGEGAGDEIVRALQLAERLKIDASGHLVSPEAGELDLDLKPLFELLVIGRGGGSIEDLWAFNEEGVARAVAACSIPIISAVGHEIDFTLSDFAADVRAETPSAAAELISSRFVELVDRLESADVLLDRAVDDQVQVLRDRITLIGKSLELHTPAHSIERGFLQLDDLRNRLDSVTRAGLQGLKQRIQHDRSRLAEQSPAPVVRLLQQRFEALGGRLERSLSIYRSNRRQRLEQLGKRLASLGPESVLHRGFALVSRPDGEVITSAGNLAAGEAVLTRFADGHVPMRVEESSQSQ